MKEKSILDSWVLVTQLDEIWQLVHVCFENSLPLQPQATRWRARRRRRGLTGKPRRARAPQRRAPKNQLFDAVSRLVPSGFFLLFLPFSSLYFLFF